MELSFLCYPRCRKFNMATVTHLRPPLSAFPRIFTNPTCRAARGRSGTTNVSLARTCPAPRERRGTIEAPSPTATTLLIASTLSSSITGLGTGPASESHFAIAPRNAEFSLPRIRGNLDRNAGVACLGGFPKLDGKIATSSSVKSGTIQVPGLLSAVRRDQDRARPSSAFAESWRSTPL